MYDNRVEWVNKEGMLHRLDGPAVEWANGTKVWCVDDKCHRLDGPAIERDDGTKEWWVGGNWHRLDGPAIVWADGSKEWFVNGKLHRLDGPAVERADGTKEWFVNGNHICDGELTIEVVKKIFNILTLLEIASLLEAIECQG